MGSFQVTSKNCVLTVDENQLNQYQISEISQDHYHLIYKDKSLQAKIISVDLTNCRVELLIDEVRYELTIDDELKMLIDSIGLRLSEKKIDDILKAPMPGLVINVSVSPNQIVKKGDSLITLEAMKMENVLKAHHDVVIKSVNVLKGEKVEKGQILIEFEN